MNFYTDQELFSDIDGNGRLTGGDRAKSVLAAYCTGIKQGAGYVAGKPAKTYYSRKGSKQGDQDAMYEVWEDADSYIEQYLREKGTIIGVFPPISIKNLMSSRTTNIFGEETETREIELDYFANLDRCVDNLKSKREWERIPSLHKYFSGIFSCQERLDEQLDDYRRMKKSFRWICLALIWIMLCVSSIMPGVPSVISGLIPELVQKLMPRLGANITGAVVIAVPLLQIVLCFFRGAVSADNYPVLFWINFPIISIIMALITALSIWYVLAMFGGGDPDLMFLYLIFLGVYVVWLLINLGIVTYIRCQEAKKKKEIPELRRSFVKEVEENAPKIHRYIRLRVLWWQHENGGKRPPYCLTHLQGLLDEAVSRAEKYKSMK